MFITFEGIEGAGKSSQAVRLADRLIANNFKPRLTHEPGGTPYAGAIRALLLYPETSLKALAHERLVPADENPEPVLPLTEVFLLSAARAQHVDQIRRWMAEGYVVISDRYADATYAYQGRGRGVDVEIISTVEQIATGGLKPDLTVLLDLPVEVGQRRKQRFFRSSLDQPALFDVPADAPDDKKSRRKSQAQEPAPGEWNRLDAETFAFHERVRAGYLELAAAEPQRWVVLDADQPSDALAEPVWQAVRERLGA
jgi:dTMP kinase